MPINKLRLLVGRLSVTIGSNLPLLTASVQACFLKRSPRLAIGTEVELSDNATVLLALCFIGLIQEALVCLFQPLLPKPEPPPSRRGVSISRLCETTCYAAHLSLQSCELAKQMLAHRRQLLDFSFGISTFAVTGPKAHLRHLL